MPLFDDSLTQTYLKPDKSWSCIAMNGYAACSKNTKLSKDASLLLITGDMVQYNTCFAMNGDEYLLFCSDSKQELASGITSAHNAHYSALQRSDLDNLKISVIDVVEKRAQRNLEQIGRVEQVCNKH